MTAKIKKNLFAIIRKKNYAKILRDFYEKCKNLAKQDAREIKFSSSNIYKNKGFAVAFQRKKFREISHFFASFIFMEKCKILQNKVCEMRTEIFAFFCKTFRSIQTLLLSVPRTRRHLTFKIENKLCICFSKYVLLLGYTDIKALVILKLKWL